MALGVKVAQSSFFSNYSSTSLVPNSFNKSFSSLRLRVSISPPALKITLFNLSLPYSQPIKRPGFQLCSSVESVTLEEEVEVEKQNQRKPDNRRKLFVLNLPWSFSVADIKNLFSECGTVEDVEIIKHKDGKNRGFAFVTMASSEDSQAAVDKFDSYEVVGRIIRVQFAKRFKKPARPPPAGPPRGETRHKLYVSNLAWKTRSNNVREFFSVNFNPVSVRVVFDSPGRSAGYGFVSFATKEEAESAISQLDGKELLGRPIRLTFSERSPDFSSSIEGQDSDASYSKEESSEQHPED